MSKQLYRVRSDGAGGYDEVVRAADLEEAARIGFDLAEERRSLAPFLRINRLQAPDEGASGVVYETTEETIVRSSESLRTGKPHAYWKWAHEEQSRAEGWILSNDSDDCATISRIDCPTEVEPELDYTEPKFEGDMAAQTFVIQRAMAGSKLHMLAVYLTGFPVNRRLNMPVPSSLRFTDLEREALPDARRS